MRKSWHSAATAADADARSAPPGYFWEHNGCYYFGGMLMYKTDPADGVVKLFYNNGRGSIQSDPLCPDPDW
jgi:hypothetical protein